MSTLTTLKKLYKQFEYCGNEEDFTNFCFNYGTITKDYRNEIERNVIFNVNGIITEVVIIKGVTNGIKINF